MRSKPIAANRLTQEQLDEDNPARIFGQTVESEALKRKREDVVIAELDGREKRACVMGCTFEAAEQERQRPNRL